MEDVTRKRILRKLESLPEEQLYQVLDYIEFVEAKYAARRARKPDPFQQFAERVEDQMRVRSLAPKAMKGTMKLISTAGRVLDGVRDLGRDILGPTPSHHSPASPAPRPSHPIAPPASTRTVVRLETGETPPVNAPTEDAGAVGRAAPRAAPGEGDDEAPGPRPAGPQLARGGESRS